MEKSTLKITGMNCGHCVNAVETALNQKEGIANVKVNLKKGLAQVKYDENIHSTDDLIAVVADAGYDAQVAE